MKAFVKCFPSLFATKKYSIDITKMQKKRIYEIFDR
jgi:hypothetical protein